MKINPNKNDFYVIKTSTEYVRSVVDYCYKNGNLTKSCVKNYVPLARIDNGFLDHVIIRKYKKDKYLVHFNDLIYTIQKFDIPDNEIEDMRIIEVYPNSNGKYQEEDMIYMKKTIKDIKVNCEIFSKDIVNSYITKKYKSYVNFRKDINDSFIFNIIKNHFTQLNLFNSIFENKYKEMIGRDIYEDIFSFTLEKIWNKVKI